MLNCCDEGVCWPCYIVHGWRLMLTWLVRSTFALFPELQLRAWYHEKVLASNSWSVAPSEIIFEALSCQTWSIAQRCAWCWTANSHLKLLDRVVRSAVYLAIGVLDCKRAHWWSVAVVCMLFKIRVTEYTLWPVHSLCRICAVSRGAFLIGTRLCFLAVELLSTSEPLRQSQCLFGMILVTLCLMVWNWRVWRSAEPMLSCWPNQLFIFGSYYFLFFFFP